MTVVQTPLRISLLGGGTDFDEFGQLLHDGWDLKKKLSSGITSAARPSLTTVAD